MSATWNDRIGHLSFDDDDLVSSMQDVLREIDQRLSWGQPDTCQAIARQARTLLLNYVPPLPPPAA